MDTEFDEEMLLGPEAIVSLPDDFELAAAFDEHEAWPRQHASGARYAPLSNRHDADIPAMQLADDSGLDMRELIRQLLAVG
jgi:hypothetical protein